MYDLVKIFASISHKLSQIFEFLHFMGSSEILLIIRRESVPKKFPRIFSFLNFIGDFKRFKLIRENLRSESEILKFQQQKILQQKVSRFVINVPKTIEITRNFFKNSEQF